MDVKRQQTASVAAPAAGARSLMPLLFEELADPWRRVGRLVVGRDPGPLPEVRVHGHADPVHAEGECRREAGRAVVIVTAGASPDQTTLRHLAVHELSHALLEGEQVTRGPGGEYLAERLGWQVAAEAGWSAGADVEIGDYAAVTEAWAARLGLVLAKLADRSLDHGDRDRGETRLVEVCWKIAQTESYRLGQRDAGVPSPAPVLKASVADALRSYLEPLLSPLGLARESVASGSAAAVAAEFFATSPELVSRLRNAAASV